MTATITPISRPNRRYCSDCTNGYPGADGCYCAFFRQFIENEACATDCAEFQAVEVVTKEVAKKRHPASQKKKPMDVMNESSWSPTHDQVAAYIKSLHTTLWGRQIIVAKEDDLHRAADWVVQMFADVREHAKESGTPSAGSQ